MNFIFKRLIVRAFAVALIGEEEIRRLANG